jgi:hypothetical protein
MKFRLYHSNGSSHANPMELEAFSVEEAVHEVEQVTGGYVHDASAFIPELDMWIAVDVWTDAFDGQGG